MSSILDLFSLFGASVIVLSLILVGADHKVQRERVSADGEPNETA